MDKTKNEINNTITELKEYFTTIYKGEIKNNENLFDAGILDSIGIANLITYIEKKFDITIDADDIIENNFNSLSSILKLIKGKK